MSNVSEKTAVAAREMIAFLVASQEFCVDVMSVREIRVWTPATPIAHAPNYVVGVVNLRGAVLPIIDFAARLGFPPTQPTTRHAILVAQIGERSVGLLVDGVSEILTVTQDQIQPPPRVGRDRQQIRQWRRRNPKPYDLRCHARQSRRTVGRLDGGVTLRPSFANSARRGSATHMRAGSAKDSSALLTPAVETARARFRGGLRPSPLPKNRACPPTPSAPRSS